MKTIAVLLLVSAAASAIELEDFHIKWNTWVLDPFRLNSFFATPLTATDAADAGWTEVTDCNDLGLVMYFYPDDPQIGLIFNSTGDIAGVQVSVLKSDILSTYPYDPSMSTLIQSKTIFAQDVFSTTAYFQDPETINTSATESTGLWFATTDGYQEVSGSTSDLDSNWKKQACIPEMGTHYYYNMSTSLECEYFQPVFLLYSDEGELSGFGFQLPVGSCTIKNRSWCEWVPAIGIKPTVPDAPDCLTDWVSKYGTITIHLFFGSEPWNISC